ncbi:DNA-formamidopyrimidine glycosylase family protein [Dermatophilaceae bacterium Soc4.6]
MPEGHTVHRLARSVTRRFGGHEVSSSSPQGRFAAGAERLDGLVLRRGEAWGKHLLVRFDDLDERVHVHLGLYGKMGYRNLEPDGPVPPPVGQVRWRLVSDTSLADLRGPTACELLAPEAVDALLDRLGPDPLRADADPDRAWQRIRRSRSAVATLLMDQSVVAGIGNVYRAEILFRHGVDPALPGKALGEGTWRAMWDDLVALMAVGVRRGRIETLRDEDRPSGQSRPASDERRRDSRYYVYRRVGLGCRLCGTTVRTRVLTGRNLFWCPGCQPVTPS